MSMFKSVSNFFTQQDEEGVVESKSMNEKFFGVDVPRDTVHPNTYIETEEVESYDINDYVSIQIRKNVNTSEYVYVVDEPELSDDEEVLYERLKEKVGDDIVYYPSEEYDKQSREEIIERKCKEYIQKYEQGELYILNPIRKLLNKETVDGINQDTFDRILYYIKRDYVYYDKITALMNDKHIEDISCNGPEVPIYIYHNKYGDIFTNIVYDEIHLDEFVRTLAQRSNKHISKSTPQVDGNLPNGYRVQLTLEREISDGSNFTVRRFNEVPLTPIDLIDYQTFDLDQMAFLWLAIENNSSLIFAGGTASGKTTSMNAVSLFIPPSKKIVSIEDTREIELPHSNWIKSTTRDSLADKGEINMYQLLENALRQRPEYIIVGEVRGEEARTLFQAMATGHTTYSTFHADSVAEAINRFTNAPLNVPKNMIQSLDLMSIQRQTTVDGNRVRRAASIEELRELDTNSGQITKGQLWDWDSSKDTFNRTNSSSEVLQNIQMKNGWSSTEVKEEIEKRRTVLEYLLENNINGYKEVSTVIQRFNREAQLLTEKNSVLEGIENDNLKVTEDPYTEYTKLFEDGYMRASLLQDHLTEGDTL